MNAKKLIWYIPVVAVVMALTITACKKDDNSSSNGTAEDTGYGMENARIDQIFSDADNLSDQAFATRNVALKGDGVLGSGCATAAVDTIAKKITISFGTANCLCKDGRQRRGTIVISYTGRYNDAGSTHLITFNNYYVNDYRVEGTKTVVYKGRNAQGLLYYTIEMSGSITNPDSTSTVSRTASHIRVWTKGEQTANPDDDEYNITGTGTLTRASGLQYSLRIIQPLFVAINCSWIKQGSVEITPIGGVARLLDYGTGACDDIAVLTVNNVKHNIKMN